MEQKKDRRIFAHMAIAFYGLACLWLYFQQSIADLTVEGNIPYQSDLPLHISMVVEDGWYYSFTAYAYKLLYVICGGKTYGIALLLAVLSVGTVYLTERLLCYFAKWEKSALTLSLALSLNLLMPIYLRFVGEYRYVSYQCANIWHNSTYICMKFLAVATLLKYFQLAEKYGDGLTWKEWVSFALLNIVCTGIKPSFLVAYSPIVGLFLLVDLIKKVPFKRILIFGSALLPSGLVILWQNAVLFGEDTGNGITFHPWYTFSLHGTIPKLAVVCSALFCGVIVFITLVQLICSRNQNRAARQFDIKQAGGQQPFDRVYLFVVLMAGLSFLEALCLVESGSRAVDGNFMWGYSFGLFVLFVICLAKWMTMNRFNRILAVIPGIIYGWHLGCGLVYFIRMVLGEGFWMR